MMIGENNMASIKTIDLFSDNIITMPIFTIIASSIAVFSFLFSLILCGKSIIEELDRRLHMYEGV